MKKHVGTNKKSVRHNHKPAIGSKASPCAMDVLEPRLLLSAPAVWTATGRIVRMDPTAALRAE